MQEDAVPGLRDPDGNIIYETEYHALLREIVALNDVATLKRYIEINPTGPLWPAEVSHWDPFYVAAVNGSTDALRLLIDLYDANPVLRDAQGKNPTLAKGPNQRGNRLLDTACYGAHPETACFLMDRKPPLGSAHDTDGDDDAPLLSAAESLAEHNYSIWTDEPCTYEWYCDRLIRGERLINILLDRGASASQVFRDVKIDDGDEQIVQPSDSVLSLAISRASYGLVKRLIDQGADVQRKQWYFYFRYHNGFLDAGNVSVLHIGSSYWNPEGIKALVDHGGSNLVSSVDSMERLPIHWAAIGQSSLIDDIIPEKKLQSQIIDTFKLLLTINPDVINAKDKKGATPLYYAVLAHARCGTGHSYPVIKYLCDNGADLSFKTTEGQTLLHSLAYQSMSGKLIDPALVEFMLLHGIDVNHADHDGNTALHVLARVLLQAKAVRLLIERGADIRATNSKGDTPLHTVMRGAYQLPDAAEIISLTLQDYFKALDDMIAVLQEAPTYSGSLMDQANADGETPQQLFEQRRAKWQEAEERRKRGFRNRKESTQ